MEGIAQFSQLVKIPQTEVEGKDKSIKIEDPDILNEEKLFDRNYISEKYGPLKKVKNRTIQCGDYVKTTYMLLENDKPITQNKLPMNLLIGSNIIPNMEKIAIGMFEGQIRKIDIASRENYSKTGEYLESINIVQEITIVSIEEVSRKDLLGCTGSLAESAKE